MRWGSEYTIIGAGLDGHGQYLVRGDYDDNGECKFVRHYMDHSELKYVGRKKGEVISGEWMDPTRIKVLLRTRRESRFFIGFLNKTLDGFQERNGNQGFAQNATEIKVLLRTRQKSRFCSDRHENQVFAQIATRMKVLRESPRE